MYPNLPEDCHRVYRGLQALENSVVDEVFLSQLADTRSIDLGSNPRSRLDYLGVLQIVKRPKPRFDGRGKGGTRLWQRDVLEIIAFVNEQAEHLTFNDISGVIKEYREDRFKQVWRDLVTSTDIPDYSQATLNDIRLRCVFSTDLMAAAVLCVRMGSLINKELPDIQNQIDTLTSFHNSTGKSFCGPDRKALSGYIETIEKKKTSFIELLCEDMGRAKELLAADERHREGSYL